MFDPVLGKIASFPDTYAVSLSSCYLYEQEHYTPTALLDEDLIANESHGLLSLCQFCHHPF